MAKAHYLTPTEKTYLKTLVERYGIARVLDALSEIMNERKGV